MGVTLDSECLALYRRFSLYNSPYVAHDDGSAVDLYPAADADVIPSPVAGEVLDVRTVRAPPQPYAETEDHLVLIDTGGHVARVLHVEPSVDPGDVVDRGGALGRPVRAGFFAPWVPVHLHLEFRPHDVDPVRASGSVRLDIAVEVRGLTWDGTGTVVESGKTWARLDSPNHPDPGGGFAGLAGVGSGAGETRRGDGSRGTGRVVIDGGLPHYEGGGLLERNGGSGALEDDGGDGDLHSVRLAGERVGTVDGRDVAWANLDILANGDPVGGIACYADRAETGVKLVGEDVGLSVGESVTVEIRHSD